MKKDFDFEAVLRRQQEEYERQRPERVAAFRAKVLPTYIDQWPRELHALSVDSVYVPFPFDEYLVLHEQNTSAPFEDAMLEAVTALRQVIPQPFFRLGSRSPKDWWYGHPDVGADPACTQPRTASDKDIIYSFGMSERVMEDLHTAKDADYHAQLCARGWVEGIEPHREFRCFMRGRELAGISVYRAWEDAPKPQITENPERWERAIREWFPRFKDASPLDDVVFDTVVLDDRVVLLEINPFLRSTYPGHFLGKDFDGRFRYIGDGDSQPVL